MAVDLLSSLNKNGSGMNITDLAQSLVQADILPRKTTAENKIESTEATISALGLLKSNVQSLDSALDVTRSFSALDITTSSNELTATARPGSNVVEQSLTIEVNQLASGQTLEFGGFASASDTLDGGTLQLEFGAWDATNTTFTENTAYQGKTMSFDDGATLAELAEQITAIGGVAARIIDKGDGTVSLGITTATGADSAIRLTATPNSAAGNSATLDQFDTTTTNGTYQITAAQNAQLKIDGISLERKTNTVSDLMDGVDLTLTQVTTNPVKIDVARDQATMGVVVDELVFQLNQTLSFINEQTAVGLDGAEAGDLTGNIAASSLKRQLTGAISDGIMGYGDTPVYLADFGIQTERDGSLTLNETKFKQQLADNPDSVNALFTDGLSSDTDGVTFSSYRTLDSAQSFDFKRDPTTNDATLDGAALILESQENGQSVYRIETGTLAGSAITVDDGVNGATLRYGVSFATNIQDKIGTFLETGGTYSRQENTLNDMLAEQQDLLETLDDRATVLEDRYRTQFGQMESIISQLNSTGEYLTNLIAAWNKDS